MNLSLRAVMLSLGLMVSLCYYSSLGGTFHFDDNHVIEGNLAVQSIRNIPSFWVDARTSSYLPENRVYRPLTYTFYAICWAVGGGSTWPFHVLKMAFHFLVCFALYLIWNYLWSIPGWFPVRDLKISFITINHSTAALLLAVLFAIHPACSECVDYIAATTSLQCAMFYVWAYFCYLAYRATGKKILIAGSLFLYFCSVASKEEGITLPVIIFMTEIFLLSGEHSERFSRFKKAVRLTLPYWVIFLVLGVWLYSLHPSEGNQSRGIATSFEYFITQWRAYLWYMRLWFWPWDLNADSATLEFSKSLFDPLVIQSAIGNFIVIVLAWLLRRRVPSFLFGVLWFYVTISPASSVVVLAEAVNEHRMYLAYIGFVGGSFAVLLYCAESVLGSENTSRLLGYVWIVLCLGLFLGTQERNRVWANDESLWKDTLEKNPTSGRAMNNLGLVYVARGEYGKSLELFSKCEDIWKTYMYCALNSGISHESLGRDAETMGRKEESELQYNHAEKDYVRAFTLSPRNIQTNFHLGRFYEEIKKDCVTAKGYFERSIEISGGRFPEAESHAKICKQIQGPIREFHLGF